MIKENKNSSIHFPGLNGIRFFAALLVFICHVEIFKKINGLPLISENIDFHYMGRMGVVLFFVLSGYLITYLLLTEKEKNAKISVRKFYIRRVLRIWPLYYLTLSISLLLIYFATGLDLNGYFNSATLTPQIILFCVFFLPNWAMAAHPPQYLFSFRPGQ